MSTAAFVEYKAIDSGIKVGALAVGHAKGSEGFYITRGDFGAFNATTNPEGIRGLTTTDTIILAQVGTTTDVVPSRRNSVGQLLLETVNLYASAALTLGTANNFVVRIVRASGSILANINVATLAEASFTANGLVQVGGVDLNILIEEGDQICLIPDGALDGTAVAGTNIFASICFKRLTAGGRLSAGTAVA
jgi:hypothetical protein